MYFIIVIALTLILPIGATLVEMLHLHSTTAPILLLGKWYVFFAVGVRLLLAGLRQTFQPHYTLKQIFEIDHEPSAHIVQELGFANISLGVLGLLALCDPKLTLAGAVTGGLFYGFAGLKHLATPGRNALRNTAMITDILVFAVLAAYVAMTVSAMLNA